MPYHCRFLNPRLKNVMCKSEFFVLFQLFSNFLMGTFRSRQLAARKTIMRKYSFFLWHLAHICGYPFQKVSHDLIKLRGVLWGDDRRIGL